MYRHMACIFIAHGMFDWHAHTFCTHTQVYITDCFGTYQVGFTLMVLGASSAIMCAVCGRLSKYIPQFVMVFFGATLMFILLSFLLIWDRVPSYSAIFTFAIGWGIADGIWSTQAGSEHLC